MKTKKPVTWTIKIPGRPVARTQYACEALHTALRKCCDSPITSVAWNVIHMLGDSDWADYGRAVVERLHGKTFATKREVVAELVKITEEHGPANAPGIYRWIMQPSRAALKCTLDLFSADDWLGFASFLLPEKMPIGECPVTEPERKEAELQARVDAAASTLARLRMRADQASGHDPSTGVQRRTGPGAEGAIDLLIERFNEAVRLLQYTTTAQQRLVFLKQIGRDT